MHEPPRKIGVIGGGTAGYFTALAIKRHFPHLEVTVVESSRIPIIGVGEATTTLMPPFLHHDLGLDIVELFHAVKPTFKMGIKFEWGLPDDYYFTYPFGLADPVESYVHTGDIRNQSLVSLLMADDRSPILQSPENTWHSLLPSLKFAYHLDNAPFVAFLAQAAKRAGISYIDTGIEHIIVGDNGRISSLRSDDGLELHFDLYVDATGFRSLLLEKTLQSPFQSYASSLYCDTAIVATVPQGPVIQPYTTAETMDHGWCWRIPVEGEDHRGYVHSSAFVDIDQATAEMRAKNPGMKDPWVVRFRSGRHRDFWLGNTIAVGNAYGFVEPLESTALHMVIIEIAYLLAGIEALYNPAADGSWLPQINANVGAHWDYLRFFLGVHYKFNRRLNTPFWETCRNDVDVSGFQHLLDRFQREGPWELHRGERFEVGDPAFGYSGLMMMLLGQKVPSPLPQVKMNRAQWFERDAQFRGIVKRALAQKDALPILRENPDILRRFGQGAGSWCISEAERFSVSKAKKILAG